MFDQLWDEAWVLLGVCVCVCVVYACVCVYTHACMMVHCAVQFSEQRSRPLARGWCACARLSAVSRPLPLPENGAAAHALNAFAVHKNITHRTGVCVCAVCSTLPSTANGAHQDAAEYCTTLKFPKRQRHLRRSGRFACATRATVI